MSVLLMSFFVIGKKKYLKKFFLFKNGITFTSTNNKTTTKMETLEQKIETQTNIARILWEKWVIEGCKKPLKLKFHYGTIVCFYEGNYKFKFVKRSGLGTGKDFDSFNTLPDAINNIARVNGWLGNKDVYKL